MSSEPVTFFDRTGYHSGLNPLSVTPIFSLSFRRKIIPTRSLMITYLIGGHTGIMAADVHLC